MSLNPTHAPHTAFVHTGGIGDFIVSLPALSRLAQEGPVELIGYPERHALAISAGLARVAHHLDSVDLASAYGTPSQVFIRFFSRFDRVVAWMRPSKTLRQAFAAAGVQQIHLHPGIPQADWESHASEYYLSCLGFETAGPVVLVAEPKVRNKNLLVIHPGSGGKDKNWPLDHFNEAAKRWEQLGGRVKWAMGPAETDFALPGGIDRLSSMPLPELARFLAQTGAFLGNDSGIAHLAAGAGCPTVAVFGPTNPQVWAPRGKQVLVVAGRPWPELDGVWHSLIRLARPDGRDDPA